MSLHTIPHEKTLFTDEQQRAMAYIASIGYTLRYSKFYKTFYYSNQYDTSWTLLSPTNIAYFGREEIVRPEHPFDISKVEII